MATIAIVGLMLAQVSLDPLEKERLETFLSNFSEASVRDFSSKRPLAQSDLLHFAYRHECLNGKFITVTRKGESMWLARLSRSRARQVVRRYFDRDLTLWRPLPGTRLVGGQLEWNMGEGEATVWSKVDEVRPLSKRQLSALTSVWYGHDEDDAEHRGRWQATVERRAGRWVLIGYARVGGSR